MTEERSRPLDGLRTLAVALVVVYHTVDLGRFAAKPFYFAVLSLGAGGVRLFFVLSGFLITGILIRARAAASTRRVSRATIWRVFHIRRVLRIFPLAYLSLTLLWLAGWPHVRWQYFAFAGNFVFCDGCGYTGLAHYWSLAMEEQFYLLWPLLILWVPRRQLPIVISGVILLSAACRGAIVHWFGLAPAYVHLPARLDSLALGGLVAVLLEGGWSLTWLTSRLVPGAFACLALGMGSIVGTRAAVFNEWGMMALSAATIAWLAQNPQSRIARVFASRPLVYLGTISWIYVWHGIVPDFMALLRERTRVGFWFPLHQGPSLLVFVSIVSILLATASWEWMEQPLNNLKRFFPYLPAAPTSAGLLASAVLPASTAVQVQASE